MQIVLNLQRHKLLAGVRKTLSSGSKEVDEIKLEVDETWKGFGKIAVFCVEKKCQYTVVDEVTQTAKIPAEVLRNEAVITIGIVGFKDEAVMTSTLVAYQVEKGSVVTIEEPEPSIYAEILSRYADLATRFNNIIANAGDLTNNAELIDARVGADDVVYDTLGEAIRGQVGSLSEDIDNLYIKNIDMLSKTKKIKINNIKFINLFDKSRVTYGKAISSTSGVSDNNLYSMGNVISVEGMTAIRTNYNNCYVAKLDSNKQIISVESDNRYFTIDSDIKYVIASPANNKIESFMICNAQYDMPNQYYEYLDGIFDVEIERYESSIDELKKQTEILLGDTIIERTDKLEPTVVYNTYYIKPNGSMVTLGSEHTKFNVRAYAVQSGKHYNLYGSAGLNGSFPIAGFSTILGTSATVDVILNATTELELYDYVYTPSQDGYIYIADVSRNILGVYETISSYEGENNLSKAKQSIFNPWYGKKVVWIGTSVSFGQYATKSYAQEVANHFGFNLVNCSVPGLAIELQNGSIKEYGSLSASKQEYEESSISIPEAPVVPYIPGGNYNGYYRTYENVFTDDNADADLWVFDVVPNNSEWGMTDWESFNKNEWKYSDGSDFSTHRNTFIGALLFLMDKMYSLNPKARMIFLLGSSFAYESGLTVLKNMKEQWNIEIIDVWGKVNTSPLSLKQLKSKDGTDSHPSTFAHEIMGKILIGEFLKIG